VIDEKKTGWKRPMAEARAFQSDFVIAEAGRKMLRGWLMKNDPVAMTVWSDICQYNAFFAEQEQFYTDVTTVSRVGVLAPPVIPSFEASVKRTQLYNALIEMNIMFDVLLLPKLTPDRMARYDVIIVPDLPFLEEEQLAAVSAYKEHGGKVYVMGSCAALQELATINAPAEYCHNTQTSEVRKEFSKQMDQLLSRRIISFGNTEYVLANVVQKTDSNQIIIHLVNYLSTIKKLKVKLDLDRIAIKIDQDKVRIYSPDGVPKQLEEIAVTGHQVTFVVPELNIYHVVVIN
jgi:hypothetical protein